MYSERGRMPATIEGITDLQFHQYWNEIKNKISDLRQLPTMVSSHLQKLGKAVTKRPELEPLLSFEIQKAHDDLEKAWKVKGYIDEYLPEWMKAASSQGPKVEQLGALPLLIGAAALAALAYVVTTGMALYQDYKVKSTLTTAVIEKKMTSGQAADIISSTRPIGFAEQIQAAFTHGALPLVLLGGGALFLFMTAPGKRLIRQFGG